MTKRVRAIGALILLLVGVSALYAQEIQRSAGAFEVLRGFLRLGTSVTMVFEGTTNDASEATLTVTDPTADRTITLPDATTTLDDQRTVTGAGGTETLTSQDCGQTILLDTAAGSVVTLPAATGSGCTFRFLVTVTNTSNDHSVVVVGNDEFVGGLISIGTTADNADAFTAADAADVDAIQMNGSTEGGLLGTWIVIQDISADNWGLSGIVISTDASATMLASGAV
jgi:hypothetical protein